MEHTAELKIIGQRIRDIRKSKGITLTELAGDLKITKGGLTKIEQGKINFTMRILLEVCAALEILPEELLKDIKPLPLEM